MSGAPVVILGYWNIRGIGQPCRLLAEFCEGLEYTERLYDAKPKEGGGWDLSDWTDEKFSMGIPFPNLPYLIHGQLKITQSTAIILYLAEKANLQGSTAEARAVANMLMFTSNDLRAKYVSVSYSGPAYSVVKPEFVDGPLRNALADLAAFHKHNGGPFLLGAELTYVDLVWWDLLDQFMVLAPELFEEEAAKPLKAFMAQVAALPKVAAYVKSDRFIDRPFNNKMAVFGQA